MPLTLGEDFSDAKAPIKRIRRDFKVAKTLGVEYLRFGFSWLRMEPKPGQYDWAAWDKIVDAAAASGVRLIPYVAYTPDWATNLEPYDVGNPPDDLHSFGRFVYALAAHYKKRNPGVIISWELWNEPDVDTWRGTPAQFAEMVKFAAQEVRRANPEAVVILGGLTLGPSEEFFLPLLKEYKLGEFVDIFAYHVYPETWWDIRTEEILPSWPQEMGEVLRTYAPNSTLWLNEFGYADYRHSLSRASMWSEYDDVFYDYEHTRDYQAAQFIRIQILNLAAGNVLATTWYRINDFKSSAEINGDGDSVNLHLGLLDSAGRPKPVYYAVQEYQKLFHHAARNRTADLVVNKPDGSQAQVYAFERADGRWVLAAWLRSSTLEEVESAHPGEPLGAIKDERSEALSVKFPACLALKSAVDAQGRAIKNAARIDGRRLKGLELKGSQGILLLELEPEGSAEASPSANLQCKS